MSAEDTLRATRLEKHQKLNGGTYPLASSHNSIRMVLRESAANTPPTSLIPEELHEAWRVHGRITNIRKSGGITFIKIADESGAIQLIASKAILTNYSDLSLLDLGDIIEIAGLACLSKTGESSILIQAWKVLTKSHLPPPEKFLGLTDSELKSRKRYLDLLSSEETCARFVVRSYILKLIRQYMETIGFMEVETSTLSSISSGANAKPFTTHHNALDIDLQLRIAPELSLKKLLVGGFEKIYEIGRNYRNEGISPRHNPEFTMMESYEAYGDYTYLIPFTVNLWQHVVDNLVASLPDNVSHYSQKWLTESPIDWSEYHIVTMYQSVLAACSKANINIVFSNTWTGHSVSGELEDFFLDFSNLENTRLQKIDVKSLHHKLDVSASVGEKIGILFEYVAEPFLTEDYRTTDGTKSCPVFITEYPKVISPLARASDSNPNVCDRFELFVNGQELANAFQELNDPDEQALRFREQLESNDKDPMAYDADYIEALEYGMPPAIGFGIGIDRLVMFLTNSESIKDVILFPTLKPIK